LLIVAQPVHSETLRNMTFKARLMR